MLQIERKRNEMPYAILTKGTDPLLNPLRGVFPRDQGLGQVDPTPMVALIVLSYVDEALIGANGLLISGILDPGLQNLLQAMIIGQRVVFLAGALGLGFRVTGTI